MNTIAVMNKIRYVWSLLFFFIMCACPVMAQMSDSQIVSYARQAATQGKSGSQIGQELLSRGATAGQIENLLGRIGKDDTENGSLSESVNGNKTVTVDDSHVRVTDPVPLVENIKDVPESDGIFGHDVFTAGGMLSFEPNENMATPRNYVIGPGDEIIIDVWGESEATIKSVVSAEGRINISQIGPVQLSGLTIEQATGKLRSVLSRKYLISGQDSDSKISVTLGNMRSIKVNVLGEVKIPGTYRLSSLSTVFNALYNAGGITPIGSMRAVRVVRGGEIVSTLDLYDYLFDGSDHANVALRDDDAIIVPSYSSIVTVQGGVKRPMKYEMLPGEPVSRLLEYAGGFASNANTGELVVERKDGQRGSVMLVPDSGFDSFALLDGDKVSVNVNQTELFENMVTVNGCVMRPGTYALGDGIATVRQLVNHAGGLLDDAFLARAQIVREKSDRSLELLSVAIGAIMDGSETDVILKRNDILTIANVNEIEQKGNVRISGYVNNPGEYTFFEGMGVEDLILLAGGLKDGASTLKADVSRRIDVSDSSCASDTLARVFSIDFKDGLAVEGRPVFSLEPYDIVSIRKSPTYVPQKQVVISGEVNFPGSYTLETANERMSDLVRRAGYATPNAFIKGAFLKRRMLDVQLDARNKLLLLADNQLDSINIISSDTLVYNVGIDLDRALDKPGSNFDVVLADGDELIVPPLINTVRIRGEVLYPNTVNYMPGMSAGRYIRQAGGFSNNARRHNVYVVYMNGKVAKGRCSKVQPGSEIVVPSKPERKSLSVGEWVGIGSTVASLSTVLITLLSLYR